MSGRQGEGTYSGLGLIQEHWEGRDGRGMQVGALDAMLQSPASPTPTSNSACLQRAGQSRPGISSLGTRAS